MNWVKENKFLTGFIVVMLIAIGALGYEVLSASSAYDEAQENYTKASVEYNRLRHLAPYPNRQNLDAYEQQKADAATAINTFEADLAKKEFPFEQVTPNGFQDSLKTTATAIRAKAQENGIALPEKFYMGFEKYETSPPNPEAAGPLARELKAIEWVLNQYLSHPSNVMQSVVSLIRADLPEERSGGGKGGKSAFGGGGPGLGGPGAGGASAGPGGKGQAAGGGGGGRRDLVKYHPFDITVICKPSALMDTLKSITGPQAPQFFVLRNIHIHNQKDKGPSKAGDPSASPDKPAGPQYIVGEEWIEVAARYDLVDFAAPGEKSPEKSASSPKPTPSRK